ncbi:MAG: DUF4230 domain-containing protein, partial [Faecousia sp.]
MEYIDSTVEDKEKIQKELVRIAKKSEFKRKLIFIVVLSAIALLIIFAAWLYGRSQAKKNAESEIAELKTMLQEQEDKIQELIETPIVASRVNPEIILDLLHSEINNIGELATVEYLFTDASKFSDSRQIKNWNIPFTEKSFILKWNGVIKAGVKLEQVTIEVNEEEKKIIVSVPPAEILSYVIDNDSVEVLNEKDNIFNNITVDDKIKNAYRLNSASHNILKRSD